MVEGLWGRLMAWKWYVYFIERQCFKSWNGSVLTEHQQLSDLSHHHYKACSETVCHGDCPPRLADYLTQVLVFGHLSCWTICNQKHTKRNSSILNHTTEITCVLDVLICGHQYSTMKNLCLWKKIINNWIPLNCLFWQAQGWGGLEKILP